MLVTRMRLTGDRLWSTPVHGRARLLLHMWKSMCGYSHLDMMLPDAMSLWGLAEMDWKSACCSIFQLAPQVMKKLHSFPSAVFTMTSGAYLCELEQ